MPLVGGKDEKILSGSIFSRVVSGFCPTSNTKVGKIVTPRHLCECF